MLQDTIPQAQDDQYSGYRALWLKVIVRAIFDWVSYRDSTRLAQKKQADLAYKWLFEPSDLFNSFSNICELIDVSPRKFRNLANTMSKDQVAKMEHLERESRVSIAAPINAKLLEFVSSQDEDDSEDY